MKRIIATTSLSAISIAFAAGTAFAQFADTSGAATQSTATSDTMYVAEQNEGEFLVGNLTGTPLQNQDGETVATVDDVVLGDDGIRALVLSVGGVLGIGARKVAVDYEQVDRHRVDGRTFDLVASTRQEELEGAPIFVTVQEKEAQRLRQQQEQMGGVGGTDMGAGGAGAGGGVGGPVQ